MNDIELLARLVGFDSVSSRPNRPIADFVAELLAAAGCRVWRQEYDGGAKVNLLARRGPEGEDGLLLSGHLDVVPADEPEWDGDPFKLREDGERLTGRGAADMKGFVAIAVNLMRAARDTELRRPLQLLLTADEELGSLGAQRFVQAWCGEFPLARNVVVGEPTDLTVVRMHKGHLRGRVSVAGRAAHSGFPHLGANAIERAGMVVQRLAALAADWRARRLPASVHFADAPFPVLNVARIQGGGAINVVPDSCQIDFGVRLLPGQQSDDAWRDVQAALSELPADVRAALRAEQTNDSPPMLCDEAAHVNARLSRLVGQRETRGVLYASDAGTLQRIALQCVLFGPGTMDSAHRPNEHITRTQLAAGREAFARVVRAFCMDEQP